MVRMPPCYLSNFYCASCPLGYETQKKYRAKESTAGFVFVIRRALCRFFRSQIYLLAVWQSMRRADKTREFL